MKINITFINKKSKVAELINDSGKVTATKVKLPFFLHSHNSYLTA